MQLDLFSLPEDVTGKAVKITPFEIEQKVQVITPDQESCELEDYYYLKDFEKKRGFVIRVYEEYKKLCYSVDFGGKQGIFYHDDLLPLA
jgi:hypothetical protein